MTVSENYMQEKYGHLGKLVAVKINGKNRTCIEMTCENCSENFYRPVYAKNRDRIFCSWKCNMTFYKPSSPDESEMCVDFDGVLKPVSHCRAYIKWNDMISRADGYLKKKLHNYGDCSVSDNFKDFKYFDEWCKKQKGYFFEGYQLDKDLLIKGNKEYSEDTCCFVPKEINMQSAKSNTTRGKYPIGVCYNKAIGYFVSALKRGSRGRVVKYSKTPEEAFIKYKLAKEEHLRFLAEKYKDVIDEKVYDALYRYEVEITD